MLAKNLAFCMSFFVWSIMSLQGGKHYSALFSKVVFYGVFSLMISVGIALFFFEQPGFLNGALQGALLGCGVSGNFALWQRALCSRKTPLDARALIGGTIIGGCLYFMFAWISDWLVLLVAAMLIAPASSVLLIVCSCGCHQVDALPEMEEERRGNFKKGLLSLIMPCLSIGIIGFVMQASRMMLLSFPVSETIASNLFSSALVIGSIALFVLFERTRYRIDMDIFYRVFAVAIGAAFLCVPVFGLWYSYVLTAGLYVVFTIASIMAILACAQVARCYRIPPISIYALSFGIIYTARYLPALVAGILISTDMPLDRVLSPSNTALICVFAMLVIYVASDRFLARQRKEEIYSWESSLSRDRHPVFGLSMEDIEAFGKQQGLTNREIDVLVKLREGRSIPYIADGLYVAENTVKYHCKNIYKKLGVHSRQELLDLLDAKFE